MSFFLPRRLIEFEYLGDSEPDEEYVKEAKPYRNDMDFAFFAVNFGYTKADYNALTPREVRFIYKAYEDRIVSQSYLIYNAVYTAFYNVNRSKRKRALKLFKKKAARVDKATQQENLEAVMESQKNDGDWVARLYKENGFIIPTEVNKSGRRNLKGKNNRRRK